MKKLPAFNGEYIRMLPVDEFVGRVRAVAAARPLAAERLDPRRSWRWRRSCRSG